MATMATNNVAVAMGRVETTILSRSRQIRVFRLQLSEQNFSLLLPPYSRVRRVEVRAASSRPLAFLRITLEI